MARDPGRESASLTGGLTWGTSIHPYDAYGQKKNARIEEAPVVLERQPDIFGGAGFETSARRDSVLAARFLWPPFSVLDTRSGPWQERKRQWIGLGIQSELGRGENAGADGLLGESEQARTHYAGTDKLAPGGTAVQPRAVLPGAAGGYEARRDIEQGAEPPKATPASGLARMSGQDLMRGEHTVGAKPDNRSIKDHAWPATHGSTTMAGRHSPDAPEPGNTGGLLFKARQVAEFDHYRVKNGTRSETQASGTSIFDPVLCELLYRWFCPPAGHVLDPFAGGSVRGIVAACMGLRYTGIDLRPEQCAANEIQAAEIVPDNPPNWLAGDSADLLPGLPAASFDAILTCPPYGDLERYSDDPRDISTMAPAAFDAAYAAIMGAAVARLAPDRFACVVISNIRGKDGTYRDLTGLTTRAMAAAGARLYNEAVLINAVGSLAIRVGKQFTSGRKLGRGHQSVLVYVKGNWKQAAAACTAFEGGTA
jgi:hypothetical protein